MATEKRQSRRWPRPYTTSFCVKDKPEKNFDVFNVSDISRGGLSFLSIENHSVGTEIVFLVNFPFLYPDVIRVEGTVVGSLHIPDSRLWKIRVKFKDPSPTAAAALRQMDVINQSSAFQKTKYF